MEDDKSLEQKQTQEEQTPNQEEQPMVPGTESKPVSSEEGQVSNEQGDVSAETYTKAQLDEALETRGKEIQSEADAKIYRETQEATKTSRQQVKDLNKQLRELQWTTEDAKDTEKFSEEPSVGEFIAKRQALRQGLADLAEQVDQFEEEKTKVTHDGRRNFVYELIGEYPDELTISDVEGVLASGEKQLEMRTYALELVNKRVKAKAALKPKPSTKIDSGKAEASGADWSKLSPDEKIQRGLEKR